MSLGTLTPLVKGRGLTGNRLLAPGYTSSSSSYSDADLATLQTPLAQSNAANQTSVGANVQGINKIELPSWLTDNSSTDQLLEQYGQIGANFDPTGQVEARNAAIGYNTSAGGQAANNAATEYSNRASQSGASQLGAGVVRAQAMMPVLAQNAALKTDAADVAAKAHAEGASLAAQIASTIGNLRTSYLQTLTGYAQGQQELQLSKYKAEQDVSSAAAQRQLGYAGLQADLYKTKMLQQQQRDSEARLAATALMNSQAPSGMWTTNNQGQVVSGQDSYNNLQNWGTARSTAQQALAGMF